ncbi:GNAT family N-acetyltransferase [Leucobacter sp. NPDC058333]|uniref:GNAT family N-acetyltransferase n=1 Tax=Leucobacter sp. NPDC058333 TaxID=3346450 RepID=UPI00365B91B3
MSASESGLARRPLTVTRLGVDDAGEVLTLQRAAYVTEAAAHRDFDLPPLTQRLEELCAELKHPDVVALGIRVDGRLLGAVRLRRVDAGEAVELGRLTVVPDCQGMRIGTQLLRSAEAEFDGASEMRLFTGERSLANIRLYERNGYVETERTPAGDYHLVHLVKVLNRG